MQTYNVSEELNRTFGAPGQKAARRLRVRRGENTTHKYLVESDKRYTFALPQ